MPSSSSFSCKPIPAWLISNSTLLELTCALCRIALEKNEIRIVQASLLGSILSNLLLILGMCFFLGGLRYREQLYNSTVTQMSACLLSLAVCSLVLPVSSGSNQSPDTNPVADSCLASRLHFTPLSKKKRWPMTRHSKSVVALAL